jgi:hypothetical protein
MKTHSIIALFGLAICFALPAFAEEQNTVFPEVRQQIEAALTQYDEAYNKPDVPALAALFTLDAIEVMGWMSEGGVRSASHRKKVCIRTRRGSERSCHQACSGVSNRKRSMRDHERKCRAVEELRSKDLCS